MEQIVEANTVFIEKMHSLEHIYWKTGKNQNQAAEKRKTRIWGKKL